MIRIIFVTVALSVCSIQGWFLSDKDRTKNEKESKLEKWFCLPVKQSGAKALGMQFFLYTRANPKIEDDLTFTPLTSTDDLINRSHFSREKSTIFIIHGYNNRWSTPWVYSMAQTLLHYQDVNVVCVDWEKGANRPYYGESAANTRTVGELVGKFITTIHQSTRIPYNSVHLIGHSLGAHVAGFAGATVQGQLGRITEEAQQLVRLPHMNTKLENGKLTPLIGDTDTLHRAGLDPAGPCFRKDPPADRLSPDDAIFVDVIHTDGDELSQLGFGSELPMGDVDFYPNGGERQPGCYSRLLEHIFAVISGNSLKESVSCSHIRALKLFEESICPASSFTAYPCGHWDKYKTCTTCGVQGCSKMGYYASHNKHGIYTLTTNGQSPFSKTYR